MCHPIGLDMWMMRHHDLTPDGIILYNVELVHPLPAAAEDELRVEVQTRIDAANTAAGSGLHEATCSPVFIL